MKARAGPSFSATSSRLSPCAHAGNPPSPPDEVTVVVRRAKGLDVAKAGAVTPDTATRDAALDVVEMSVATELVQRSDIVGGLRHHFRMPHTTSVLNAIADFYPVFRIDAV